MADIVTTVDLDAASVRILQTNGRRVERWATARLYPATPAPANGGEPSETDEDPGPAPAPGLPTDSEVASVVRGLVRSSGMKKGPVAASISSLYSIARLLTIPLSADGGTPNVAQAVRDAVASEEMRLRWQLLEPKDELHRVLVLGAPTDVVEHQVELLRSADLAPSTLETKGMALARAVGRSDALIAHVERATVDIVLVSGGIPQVMRAQPIPPSASSEERADHVAQALRQTARYHDTHHDDGLPPDTPLFIVGPEAADPVLLESVRAQVDYDYEEFLPDLEYPPSLPVWEYAVNLGLALRGRAPAAEAGGGTVPLYINLMAPRQSIFHVTPAMGVIGGAALFALAVLGTLYGQLTDSQAQTQRLESELAPIERQVDARRVELGKLSQLEGSIAEFQELTAPWGHVAEIRDLIESTVIDGITISSLTVNPEEVSLAASADSIDTAIDFVEALRATGRFESVEYPRTSTNIAQTLKLLPPPAT
ncbi:MAG: hypothetical protein IIA53_05340 [Chloroflexi bacterium]|nr:hypothetical protein [Chloroflexota bacterium]